jgi:hypothetical protein
MALENREKEQDATPLGRELFRMEAKLNLALLLLGDLRREKQLPAWKPAALSADGISWQDDDLPLAGQRLTLEIYLNPYYPYPLRLPLEVLKTDAQHWVTGQWLGLDPMLQEQLTQYIFRAHRRAIGRRKQLRHGNDPDSQQTS